MEKKITKADIVDIIAKNTGITKIDTKAVVEGTITAIIDAVVKGYKVEIRGFGVFNSKKKKAKLARNPRNGQPVQIDERIAPVFRISNEFTKKVNANTTENENKK